MKVMDFGAFVNFFGAKDGLVHISPARRAAACRRSPTSSRKATRSRSSCSASTIAARSACPCVKAVDQGHRRRLKAKEAAERRLRPLTNRLLANTALEAKIPAPPAPDGTYRTARTS